MNIPPNVYQDNGSAASRGSAPEDDDYDEMAMDATVTADYEAID